MGSITVRNLDEAIKNSLRVRATRHGWSMEQEIRQILQQTVAPEQAKQISFAERVNQRFASLKVERFPIAPRQATRTPPNFGKP